MAKGSLVGALTFISAPRFDAGDVSDVEAISWAGAGGDETASDVVDSVAAFDRVSAP